ncbi:MAG: pyrroloquinoline quinone biosynthesis protein PqqB [Anaerolineae bacterium]|nr:pyrroloquinoline quinone biosynthesis protein PqqB [Anaerolineae bacterium]
MSVKAILLGNAQDGGLPQAGCGCTNCARAWADAAQRRHVACLGLVDRLGGKAGQGWLIDATPDFREQLHLLGALTGSASLAGILLTHAHIGHYAGLIHLGREAWAPQQVPVYASAQMAAFLASNAPWSQLISLGQIEIQVLAPGQTVALSPRLSVTPLAVPHRAEFSDTLAFVVEGPARRLLYCPDTDTWARWEKDVRALVSSVEVALLDGCFFSADELPGRDMAQIPHPLATDTAERLAGVACDVRLIHLNHSNPLHWPGPERAWLAAQGVGVGLPGEQWSLGG